MLYYDVLAAPDGTAEALTVVLLHGRGADEKDLAGFRNAVPSHWTLVLPRAPFAGAQWGYGGGYAWYRYLGENRPEPESFTHSLDAVGELLDSLPGRLDARADRVLLGGFSQGGTLSLGYAIAGAGRNTLAPGLIANLSGFLPDHPEVRVDTETASGKRFFWAHGRMDPAIPFAMATQGRADLAAAGADLTTFDEPGGHWIEPDAIQKLIEWVG